MARDFLRYGMVGGLGFIGAVHRAANRFDFKTELVAGCFSRSEEKNKEAADTFNVERVYSDYKEMARKEAELEDGIDFVSVVTPNVAHYEICKEFLLNGINVVCEKPLCFTIEQAKELKKIAEEKDLMFGVTYTYMGYPMVKLAKQMVEEGKIGKIINVNAEYPQEWLIDALNGDSSTTAKLSGWRSDPAVAGAANCIGDIGTHIENVVAYVTGLKIKRVAAAVDYFGQDLDLNANILVEYDNGARGVYWCSQVSMGHYNDLVFRIFGTNGSIEWHQENPEYLKVCLRNKPMEYYYRGTGNIYGNALANQRVPSGHVEGFHVAFANIYRAYGKALLKKMNGEELTKEDMDFPTVDDGLEGVKFITACVESGKKDSEWVTL
ncbi:MAG: Gfo/Idh/MocA family oxidoreductase [Oscillospiraceae bacterium]|nr:Gfo/Idh/MocA family oxidoreductase [Oscillospiraceae bacterium]